MTLRYALPLTLALATPAMADITDMTDAERAAFGNEVRAYLLENPQVLMEAIAVLEGQQQQAQVQMDDALVQSYMDMLHDDGNSWVGGNPEGDITIVEFMDYRCGYCRRAFEEVETLVASDSNIRFIVKEFPILGEQSLLSAKFAVAVKKLYGDDTYKAMHDILIALNTDMTPDTVSRLAASYDLNGDDILAEMDSADTAAVIDANHALGNLMQITGTPTFVIGDRLVRGYVPLEQMVRIVAEERED